jgi:cysteine desulfurase
VTVRARPALEATSRAYLDHASTSPPRPQVVEAMLPWFGSADPGRVHTEGRMARVALEDAREQVADFFGARPREVVFTSGATESINMAVFGATASGRGEHVVVPAVEHSAVRDSSARHRVTEIDVDRLGRVSVDEIIDAITDDTSLVHCQWGNHEVGTLQPVHEVIAACRERDVLVHVDAAQAAGRVPVNFVDSGADLLSISAHKLGGPKGIGALLVRRGLRLPPLLLGGDQERARRAGMEDVAAAVGFAGACASVDIGAESTRSLEQTERLLKGARSIDGVTALGDTSGAGRLPHLVCFDVAGVEAEAVLLGLDQSGIAAHSGSACSSESLEPSPVLQAMGVEAERSLRLSVGWSTTDIDIELALSALPAVIERLRALR